MPPTNPDIDAPPGNGLSAVSLAALVASLLVGAGVALALMPAIFRSTPTDLSRIGTVLETLRASEEAPRVVALGDSVVMSGVEGRVLRQALPGEPLAWNLASTGQALPESYLITQALPDSVETVLYGLRLRPRGEEGVLEPQKQNAFHMFGFRPSEHTREVLASIYPETESLFARSHLRQLFASRWVVRQLADTRLRMLLRRDLAHASAALDLLHPQLYAEPVAAPVLEGLLARRLEGFQQSEIDVAERTAALARVIAAEAAERGRRTVFLLLPVHPRLRDPAVVPWTLDGAFDFSEESVPHARVLDLSTALEAEDFIDHVHPTNAGARKLTLRIAELLSQPEGAR